MFKELSLVVEDLKQKNKDINLIMLCIVIEMLSNDSFDEITEDFSDEDKETLLDFIIYFWRKSIYTYEQVVLAILDCLKQSKITIDTINDSYLSARYVVENYCSYNF